MQELKDDLRFALRLLFRQPGFAIVALLTLGLGIGANVTIFSIVNSVLLRPLPYAEPQGLVHLSGVPPRDSNEAQGVSLPDLLDYRRMTTTMSGMAAYSFYSNRLVFAGDGEPEQVEAATVSANFFALLGVQPLYGRTFREGEDQRGQNGFVVLSHAWWMTRFGGDVNVIGRKLSLNYLTYEVVGIMPPDFQFPERVAAWIPISTGSPATLLRDAHIYMALGRLRPGVSVTAARDELRALGARLEQTYPNTNKDYRAQVKGLAEHVTGDVRPTLYVLVVAVGALLLIVCGNIANLLLARATARRREFGIRAAVGAPRGRLIRQLLTESLVLAGMGGALGLAVSWWLVRVLRAANLPTMPRLSELSVDGTSVLFTVGVIMGTALLFGIAPALQATDLKEAGARGSTGGLAQNKLRGVLVIAEVALATFLLIGAGLLIESMRRLLAVDAGFAVSEVTILDLSLPSRKFAGLDVMAQFVESYLQRVRAVPGVESAAATISPPLGGLYSLMDLTLPGEAPQAFKPSVGNVSVSPGYFETFRIPLLKGRLFEARDTKEAPHVVIISEPMARQYFPGKNPLGRQVMLSYGSDWTGEVVGVVAGIRRRGLAEEPRAEVYLPFAQMPYPTLNIVVRSTLPAGRLAGALKQEMRQIDANVPLNRIRPMQEVVLESIAASRIRSLVTAFFAGAALLLASIGIYGVMAYSVSRRTAEIGIRMALGASPWQILRLVMQQSLMLVGLGIATGILLAAGLGSALASLLYGISAWSPAVYLAVALLLAAVAGLATLIPAWRATRIDPAIALRD